MDGKEFRRERVRRRVMRALISTGEARIGEDYFTKSDKLFWYLSAALREHVGQRVWIAREELDFSPEVKETFNRFINNRSFALNRVGQNIIARVY